MQPSTIQQSPIIQANSHTKRFGNLEVLKNITLQVWPGEFLAIVGPSGNGKSTLLHILGCIDRPTTGDVYIMSKNTNKLTDRQLAKLRNQTLGFVFQFFYMQPHLTIAKNIEIPLMPARISPTKRRKLVQNVAELVGITSQLQQKPSTLSGGQLQRAAIARAINNQPKAIIADEPTDNLDTANGANIINLLLNIKNQQNTALIIVTHDQQIAHMADRIISLENGTLQNVKI